MKRIFRILVIAVTLTAFSAATAWAGNDERRGTVGAAELLINPWAHSNGWGGVNVACVQGLASMYNNVAGLAFIKNIEVSYTNMMLYGGSNKLTGVGTINTFGLGIRVFESSVLGVYVMSLGFGELPVTTYDNPDPGMGGTFSPSYMNVNVAFSHSFTNTIHGGIVVKLATETTDNISASGFAIDAGIQYVTGENDELKFGLSLKNWGPTMSFSGTGHSLVMQNNAGNNFTVETRAAEMQLPTCFNIGLSYDFLFEVWNQKLTLAGSFTSNAFARDNYTLGLEYSLLDRFQARAGYVYSSGLLTNNLSTANNGVNAGASVIIPIGKDGDRDITIDYAYTTAHNLRGTHSIGATLRF